MVTKKELNVNIKVNIFLDKNLIFIVRNLFQQRRVLLLNKVKTKLNIQHEIQLNWSDIQNLDVKCIFLTLKTVYDKQILLDLIQSKVHCQTNKILNF